MPQPDEQQTARLAHNARSRRFTSAKGLGAMTGEKGKSCYNCLQARAVCEATLTTSRSRG